MEHNTLLSGLEVTVALCPHLSNTVISRYAFDVISAFCHFREQGNEAVQIPHANQPVNEFRNPLLFPRLYPTLFPYGVGGVEDSERDTNLSFKRSIKHLFSLHDKRFQEHYSFLFITFNMLQRREILLHTALKVRSSDFDRIAQSYANVCPEAIATVVERLSKGDYKTFHSKEEKHVLDLMKEVNVITANVPGSSAAKVQMRNEIRGLIARFGLPSFYITINPADVYNPLVKFLAGEDIDIDQLSERDVPDYHEQSLLIAKNPAVGAQFFNIYLKAFIHCILGYENDDLKETGGILGHVQAHYGCVEAQGRGTLHCHLIIWLNGAQNVDEIRRRVQNGDSDFERCLIDYLDDTISTEIPKQDEDIRAQNMSSESGERTDIENTILNSHPCATRGISPTYNNGTLNDSESSFADFERLVKNCQCHRHMATCYKYWKGPPEPKTCRFNLDDSNRQAHTYFDTATGDLHMRCLDGLVNNFNSTILRCIRSNMDIKFIGSGPSAKAVLYYITDYITKSQLKAHVAFAALELAVKKLNTELLNMDANDPLIRAKRLLQKCAFSMISRQELSAPQVMSYLLDLEDHFTSHKFCKFYWHSFERFVNQTMPIGDNPHDPDTHDVTLLPNNDMDEDDEMAAGIHADDDTEEIVVTDVRGSLVAHSTLIADYQLRGPQLKEVSLWNYLVMTEKTKLSDTDNNILPTEDINHQELLTSTSWNRPRIPFDTSHPQHDSHTQKIVRPERRPILVPNGPSLPRRDRPCELERYHRLMLIFFKPWSVPTDLKNQETSWNDAFIEFSAACPDLCAQIMNNMQLMHECRDSRDEHFAERFRVRPKGGSVL